MNADFKFQLCQLYKSISVPVLDTMKQAQFILSLPLSTTLKPGQNVWKKIFEYPWKEMAAGKSRMNTRIWSMTGFILSLYPPVLIFPSLKSTQPETWKWVQKEETSGEALSYLWLQDWEKECLMLRGRVEISLQFFSVSSFSYAQAPSNPVVGEQVAAAVTGTSKNENSERELSSLFYGATVPGG